MADDGSETPVAELAASVTSDGRPQQITVPPGRFALRFRLRGREVRVGPFPCEPGGVVRVEDVTLAGG